MQDFASRLKQYREAANLTQTELAAAIGSSQSAVGNWESGSRKSPRGVTLHAIAQTLQVPLEALLGLPGPGPAQSKLELQLLAVFRALPPHHRPVAVRLLKALRVQ